MTTAAICATREVSWSPSFYRGEQYDPDLGLYYLRARYYNPATGRFLSRDPNDPALRGSDGTPTDPAYLHKYLYANGDPINGIDPMGREALIEMKLIKKFLTVPAVMGLRIAAATICAEYEFIDRVLLEPFEHGIPWPAMLPCDLYAVGEGALLVAELIAE